MCCEVLWTVENRKSSTCCGAKKTHEVLLVGGSITFSVFLLSCVGVYLGRHIWICWCTYGRVEVIASTAVLRSTHDWRRGVSHVANSLLCVWHTAMVCLHKCLYYSEVKYLLVPTWSHRTTYNFIKNNIAVSFIVTHLQCTLQLLKALQSMYNAGWQQDGWSVLFVSDYTCPAVVLHGLGNCNYNFPMLAIQVSIRKNEDLFCSGEIECMKRGGE